MGRKTRDPRERFWEKVNKDGPTLRPELGPCWIWSASLRKDGYGQVHFRGQARAAHKVAWILERFELGRGECVCHACDNPACVRPDHLFVGTHEDNVRDKVAKGRHPTGSNCWQAKLSDEDVGAIRAAVLGGQSQKLVAAQFGINQGYVSKLVSNLRRVDQTASSRMATSVVTRAPLHTSPAMALAPASPCTVAK